MSYDPLRSISPGEGLDHVPARHPGMTGAFNHR